MAEAALENYIESVIGLATTLSALVSHSNRSNSTIGRDARVCTLAPHKRAMNTGIARGDRLQQSINRVWQAFGRPVFDAECASCLAPTSFALVL